MLFNSYIFILCFLPITLIGWFSLNRIKNENVSKVFLLIMSLVFYAYFNIRYLPIILISILVNYSLYLLLQKRIIPSLRKLVLIFGILLNVGLLFYYKYLGFFTENINAVFHADFVVKRLLLPLGISFFTFQQLSFVIDCYKSDIKDCSLLNYALFVSFFPQLIAGPIVLYDEMIPQFADTKNKRFNSENFSKGLFVFSLGLGKKVLVADPLGNLANIGFGNIPSLNSSTALISMLAYTLQIYFDFSGYCDMAIGIGYMFNIDIPINFNSPYRALDMNDFWKRWHITLTRFLTKNLYIPLGGNRKGKMRTYVNQMIVFLVSGIWHGANWTFILWGALNGISVILSKILSPFSEKLKKKARFLPWLVTFVFINLMWVVFRADSIQLAGLFYQKLFSLRFGAVDSAYLNALFTSEFSFIGKVVTKVLAVDEAKIKAIFAFAFFLFATVASVLFKNTSEQAKRFKPNFWRLAVSCALLVWSVLSFSGVSTFLYFNF
ncbi:MAG TPA: membrane-bound O-acyltransferase family protein [Ruminococcaceae bacterium]|nr:membrane-bound O-acyltransferase family protein [Oscillospiraceae bacterium]